MGLIKDFNELPTWVKAGAASIVILAGFWALIFYKYQVTIFNLSIYKILLLVTPVSILWYLIEWAKAKIIIIQMEKLLSFKFTDTHHSIAIFLDGLFYLIIITFGLLFFNTTLTRFIFIAFSVHFFLFMWSAFLFIRDNRKK